MSEHRIPSDLLKKYDPLGAWSILISLRGSLSHGTYEPNHEPNSIDDKDAIAITVPPLDHYFGLNSLGRRGTLEIMEDPWDVVVYESRKALEMLKKGNPSVLSMLWVPEDMHLFVSPAGRLLIENRDLFSTLAGYMPFIGYARSNLMKMEGGANLGYMGDKRKRLVEKHGYDTKRAMHLIRLLRMVLEFLEDGQLRVWREDASELLEIKHGEWSLEKVKAESDRLAKVAEEMKDKSPLPREVDRAAINDLAVQVAEVTLKLRGELGEPQFIVQP